MAVPDEVRALGVVPQARGGEFDRSPPQDIAAEQSVLGGMLLSKDAIADVVEIVRSNDFYKPAHSLIFDTILDLYGRAEPADPITIASVLTDAGEIARIGGAPYLHTLVASVPTAANAAYYARIVAERAVLRRLIEAGTRIAQLGYGAASGAGRDVDSVVDLAQQAIYDVTEKRVSEDFSVLGELLQPTLDEIEAIGAQGGVMSGVPTGFTDLDRLLNGLHPGQLIIVAGRPGLGKALALDTPLPTPDGWTTMGEVAEGDRVLGADGRPTTVVRAFDVLHGRPCFEVVFSDGSTIVADAHHLWKTSTRASRHQQAERRLTHQWSRPTRDAVAAACRAATAEPDTPITFDDALVLVGSELRSPLHAARQEAGQVTRVTRSFVRAGKPWNRKIPAYSRQRLLQTLAQRVNRPRNAGAVVTHPDTVTTAQIAASLRCTPDGRLNHAVEVCQPLSLPHRDDLPIPPYTLGVWLGGGHSDAARFTSADPEIASYVEADGFVVRCSDGLLYSISPPALEPLADRDCVVCGTRFTPRGASVYTCGRACGARSRGLVDPQDREGCASCGRVSKSRWSRSRRCTPCHRRYGSFVGYLRAAGVLANKHVPTSYLRASEAQRRALLAGLLDTDGTVAPTGIVQYAATSRQLAEGVHELATSLGFRCTMTSEPVNGRSAASSIAYSVNFSTADDVFRLERKRQAHDERRRASDNTRTRSRFIVDVRPVPSVPVRCIQVDNGDHLYLAGRSMIPTHNSTAALDFARSASVHHGLGSVIFSLEMSKIEIVMRMLSAESRVPLHVLRSGQLSDDDWTKLARRMGEVSEAPMYVDDTPNLTMMEIRAKARRLKQRHDLKMVVVDYLQLMTSPKRTESRQQEVAELSRGLKLLAKELEVPVIAVSQLNRGPENRTDKRPQLSDLRESGCLPASTRVLRADTGAEVTLGDLLAADARDIPVWSLDESMRYVRRTMTHVFPSGRKDVFRLRLASGRQVEATANHPFLTFDGWRSLGDVQVGTRVATPRHVGAPMVTTEWPEAEVVMLAHLIGDGSFVRRQPVRYASTDEANLRAVTEAAAHFGITAVRDDHAAARCTSLRLPAPHRLARGRRNPIAEWLDKLGLFDLRSHEKFVPAPVFALPKSQIALFLHHLWSTDGWVWWDEQRQQARIHYAATSRRLVDQIARLFMRFGIHSRIETVRQAGCRDGYQLVVSDGDDQLRFLREIGVHGACGRQAARCLAQVANRRRNTNRDTVPVEVWQRVRATLTEQQLPHRQAAAPVGIQSRGSASCRSAPSRQRLAEVAAVLDGAELEMIATNDVYWDEVVAVEPLGEQDVYDATVLGTHNFVANGIAVHNSIEQDADVVLLLHRDDYYDKESPRAGEADFIVAKHRNGPTDTVTVAAQLHLSRFVDMAVV